MIDQLGLDAWQLVLLGIAAVVLITMFISEEKKKPKKDTLVAVWGQKVKIQFKLWFPMQNRTRILLELFVLGHLLEKNVLKLDLMRL